MDEFEAKKISSREKEELEKNILDAVDVASEYGFYYIVINDILPKIFASDSFKKIAALTLHHQGQRWAVKNDVEYQLLTGYASLKEDLKNSNDQSISQQLRDIDIQIHQCVNTRVGWKHVYDKIQALLKYLLLSSGNKHIAFKYAKVVQQTSSIEFVINALKFVPDWKRMQQIESMFTRDEITDVCVAAILLDGLLKSWNAAKDEKNVFDLDIDSDLQLFLVSVQQDNEEFIILRKERSKYQGNLSFFTKRKILSCLNLVISNMFDEELVRGVGISPNDCFEVVVRSIGSQPYLLLEMTSIKQATIAVYILKNFKGGASSKIYKLTNYIFGSKNEIVINIADACVKYKLKELTWSEYISKINFQFFQNIVFRGHDEKNCVKLQTFKFSGKDLSPELRQELGELLPTLTKL